MSTQIAPEPQVNGHESPGTADGSPSDQGVIAETTETTETGEGLEPEPEAGAGVDPRAELQRLRDENEALQARTAEAESIFAAIDRSPYAAKVNAYVRGLPSEEADDPVSQYVATNWPAVIETEDGRRVKNPNHDAVMGLVKVLRQSLAQEASAPIAQELQGMRRTLNGNRFAETLKERGLDPQSPEVKAFEKELSRDPDRGVVYRKSLEAKPAAAAHILADAFGMRNRVRQQVAGQRARIEDAKGSRTNGNSPRGGATATRQFVYDPKDRNNDAKLLAFYQAGGKREGVVRKK